jgi:hypothetical protein
VLPQLSVTVHDFVTVLVQPVPVGVPTIPIAVKPVLQLSVTVAAPKAAAICAGVGLQGREPAVPRLIAGFCVSLV